jgi:hypothetical protein
MTTRPLLLSTWLALALAGGASAAPASAPEPSASAVFSFAGKPYLHRWSQKGQNEFTPPGQPDLAHWQDMVTIQVYDQVTSGEALAGVANAVLVAYQKAGLIIRTSSLPAQPGRPAEHMIVAVLQDQGLREMVFARFRLTPDAGEAIVYSHRVYGTAPDAAASAWLRANDLVMEKAMMAWTTIPSPSTLQALPQSP